MSSMAPNQNTSTAQPVPDLQETTGASPLASTPRPTYKYTPRRVPLRSRIERVGYWVLVAAAFLVLLALLGIFLPKFVGAALVGGYVAGFTGLLTLMNLSQMSGWGNSLLGRKVFPVLSAPDADILRLARTNAGLVFLFTFVFQVVASFIGAFWGGLIVFGALVAAAVFYYRGRTVITRP